MDKFSFVVSVILASGQAAPDITYGFDTLKDCREARAQMMHWMAAELDGRWGSQAKTYEITECENADKDAGTSDEAR